MCRTVLRKMLEVFIGLERTMRERYLLRLGNGQGWEFVAAERVEPWEEMERILL